MFTAGSPDSADKELLNKSVLNEKKTRKTKISVYGETLEVDEAEKGKRNAEVGCVGQFVDKDKDDGVSKVSRFGHSASRDFPASQLPIQ